MTRSTTPRAPRKSSPRSTAPSAAEMTAPDSPTGGRPVTVEEIARRAYELYEARGCTDGAQVDDWLLAEQQLADISGATGSEHTGPLSAAKRKRSPKSGAASQ
ncbi:MAG: DUF2934 domain-containing protein [Acidobacteriota bacterium]